MSLLQISEPGMSPEPHKRRHAIGIDLGTTNSLVATVRSGTPETLPDVEENHLLPSVVHYAENGETIVGYRARELAPIDSLNTLVSIKRYMGRGVEDVARLGTGLPYELSAKEGGMISFHTRSGKVSPVEASAEILRELVLRAETALDAPLDGAVITVPAYFDEAQRQATKDAAMLAGIKVLRLLNEPTAAAVAYGLDRGEEGVIAIYDLGGGTFDISILRLTRGVFEVLATGGDSALGGDDFDRAIADWIRIQAGLPKLLTPRQQRELLDAACEAKESLTDCECIDIAIDGWSGVLDRNQFVELVDDLIDKTLRACRRTLRDAGLKPGEVAEVVMVGGSTRVPRVRERVAELFGGRPRVDIDPDRVVAIGAALQADVLVGNKPGDELLLLDVIPLSLGIETMGGLMEKIIHRNTTIPVSMAQDFTTFKDGQTAMAIHVLQGERELVSDSRSLARFELRNIPPMVAGAAKVRVTFQVDADGLLNVSARELTSGVESHIEVRPSYGLSEEEVARMLQESYSHAREDMQIRALREQQVEAERMIEDLTQALVLDGEELLSEEETHCLKMTIENLRRAHSSTQDHRRLAHEIEAVAKASEEFASRRMNYNIRRALAGHKLDEIERDM